MCPSGDAHRMMRLSRARCVCGPAVGFTLLELLVVLAVAAVATAFAGLGGQSYLERSRYHQTVRDIAGQLRQARALSVQEGRPVPVVYDPQTRRLMVGEQMSLDIPDSLTVQWDVAQRNPAAPPSASAPIFVFNADGGARGGRVVVWRGAKGAEFRVNWLLGTVEQIAVASES